MPHSYLIAKALSVFIYPRLGNPYVRIFSQGPWENKSNLASQFSFIKILVSSNACFLFISAFQAGQGPLMMSLSLATAVLWLQFSS
jgi:hypothetical protein